MVDDESAVLEANQRFYDAHEQRAIDAMIDVWDTTEDIVCIHPGWPILRGHAQVIESWRRILDGPGRNQFILTNLTVSVADDIAVVVLDENLVAGAAAGTIAATNIFRRGDSDEWQLIHHHGSPVGR